jgi:hypothetical protein
MYKPGELMAYYKSQTRSVHSNNVRSKSKGKARIPLAMMASNIQSVLDFEEERTRRLENSREVNPGILRHRA